MKIGIVGPCTAGKSTLATLLVPLGYEVRQIAQEHSFAPAMWQRISNPDLLIFLEVSFDQSLLRKKLNWTFHDYLQQRHRLRHAHANAHLIIDTDPLTPQQVLETALAFIKSREKDTK